MASSDAGPAQAQQLESKGSNILFIALAAVMLAPLTAVCIAAESPRPVAPPSPGLPAKADLPDVGKSQGKRYNVLFIAVDDLFRGTALGFTINLDPRIL